MKTKSDGCVIEVKLSAKQLAVFERLAKEVGAKPSEVILSLACERTESNPAFATDAPYVELGHLCWQWSYCQQVPDAKDWFYRSKLLPAITGEFKSLGGSN